MSETESDIRALEEDRLRFDRKLPVELSWQILESLSQNDVLRSRLVCKDWKNIIDNGGWLHRQLICSSKLLLGQAFSKGSHNLARFLRHLDLDLPICPSHAPSTIFEDCHQLRTVTLRSIAEAGKVFTEFSDFFVKSMISRLELRGISWTQVHSFVPLLVSISGLKILHFSILDPTESEEALATRLAEIPQEGHNHEIFNSGDRDGTRPKRMKLNSHGSLRLRKLLPELLELNIQFPRISQHDTYFHKPLVELLCAVKTISSLTIENKGIAECSAYYDALATVFTTHGALKEVTMSSLYVPSHTFANLETLRVEYCLVDAFHQTESPCMRLQEVSIDGLTREWGQIITLLHCIRRLSLFSHLPFDIEWFLDSLRDHDAPMPSLQILHITMDPDFAMYEDFRDTTGDSDDEDEEPWVHLEGLFCEDDILVLIKLFPNLVSLKIRDYMIVDSVELMADKFIDGLKSLRHLELERLVPGSGSTVGDPSYRYTLVKWDKE